MSNFSVEVRSDEPFEKALRRFTSKTRRAGLLRDLKKRRFYTKPSVKEDRQAEEHTPSAKGIAHGCDRTDPRRSGTHGPLIYSINSKNGDSLWRVAVFLYLFGRANEFERTRYSHRSDREKKRSLR